MKKEVNMFLEVTKYKNLTPSDQSLEKPQPELETPVTKETIDLPPITTLDKPETLLHDAIINRQSLRKYSDDSLTMDELSYLLYMSIGIKQTLKTNTRRTVPSAGARHAFDMYILVNNVKGLQKGVYRYSALTHKLVIENIDNTLVDKITKASLNQVMIKNSAVTFILVADPYRMSYRYSERGYRYLFLDAGHVSQNIYLVAETLQAGTVAIAAYDDDLMNEALNLDGINKFVIYLNAIGKKIHEEN
ncbi:SagB/ThcOx family dehydrogenase [Liberiplasma polymorphum]|uniref:SagB/ThcOx family dehydrogenase n=1 Tax=Liberiplasma polymorphum TaxID=3374570 RepID=UPI003775E467